MGLQCNAVTRRSSGFCLVQGKPSLVIEAEQEERRMSDLSDWASSVTSVADIQVHILDFLVLIISRSYLDFHLFVL